MSTPLTDDPQPPSGLRAQKTQPDGASARSPPESQALRTQAPGWKSLEAQVRPKPNDADAWLKFVDVAVASGDYDRVNETYEVLLEAYPNTVRIANLSTILALCLNFATPAIRPTCIYQPHSGVNEGNKISRGRRTV